VGTERLRGGAQAIFQCLQGLPEGGMRRLILTASGGAFRDWPVEKLVEVTPALAVTHPNWRSASPPTPPSQNKKNQPFPRPPQENHWLHHGLARALMTSHLDVSDVK
jgi:hypothetical protein